MSTIASIRVSGIRNAAPVDMEVTSSGAWIGVGDSSASISLQDRTMRVIYASLRAISECRMAGATKDHLARDIAKSIAHRTIGVDNPGALAEAEAAKVEVTIDNGEELSYGFSARRRAMVNAGSVPKPESIPATVYVSRANILKLGLGYCSAEEMGRVNVDATWKDTVNAMFLPEMSSMKGVSVGEILPVDNYEFASSVVCPVGQDLSLREGSKHTHPGVLSEEQAVVATIARLIACGEISEGSVVFWEDFASPLCPGYDDVCLQVFEHLEEMGAQVIYSMVAL